MSEFQPVHEHSQRMPLRDLKPHELPQEKESTEEFKIFRGLSREVYGNRAEKKQGKEAREMFERVCSIAEAIREKGGRALLVGGSVRDEILGLPSKDFDLEVYGIPPDRMEEALKPFGKMDLVGKAFGIIKITDGGMDIDVSIPRRDSKVHEDGEVHVAPDPDMSIREAAKRRDFTFNALSKDPLIGDIFDPFNGIEDLRTRTLRVTDTELFKDDPLRVMRGAQFIGRFGLKVDPPSMKLFQEMVPLLHKLPKERFYQEWNKLLLKSERPARALQALFDMGVIETVYPEFFMTKGTPQEFEWHPEGDVWVHTLMVVDEASRICKQEHLDEDTTETIMLASLCHDLGKPKTTQQKEGRWRSQGHEPAGEESSREFLKKIGTSKEREQKVVALVKEHLWPGTMYRLHKEGNQVSDGTFRRLAKRLFPATITELTYVAQADHQGRGPFADPDEKDQFLLPPDYPAGKWVRSQARRLGVEKEPPKPILLGRDLIGFGLKPGKEFGELIKLSEQLRDDQNVTQETLLELLIGITSFKEVKQRMEFLFKKEK